MKMRAILAPYVATPPEVVSAMLDFAELHPGDLLHDLGCGDGRICIAAARDYGARAVGVDIEPYWVEQSQINAAAAGVTERTSFHVADACDWNVADATVITLYLVHWSTDLVARQLLAQVREGTRIVSHSFAIEHVAPAREKALQDSEGNLHRIYLWVVGKNADFMTEPHSS